MIYYGATNLANSFRTVRKNTITIAEEIPEDKYAFRGAPGAMSVAELLAHIAVTPRWQIELVGRRVTFMDFAMFAAHHQERQAQERELTTKPAILAALREGGDQFAAFLGGLSEETLAETVSFPPPIEPATKSRFEMLLGIKEHEMHHRAQLMLVQRLLGQVPHLTRMRQARAQQATQKV